MPSMCLNRFLTSHNGFSSLESRTYGGLGVHNIHQNQGDPAGSEWWSENGIWQDGGTIVQGKDNSVVAFLTKFKTQAYWTDSNGHPIP